MENTQIIQRKLPCMSFNDLRLWVHLGEHPEERHQVQMVSVQIDVTFLKGPRGLKTDEIKDTLCYDKIIAAVQKSTETRHFNLIEFLAKDIYESIETYIEEKYKKSVHLHVEAKKIAPPVVGLLGGIAFSYDGLINPE